MTRSLLAVWILKQIMLLLLVVILMLLDLPIVAEFGIRSPTYMADEGNTLTVPIDLVDGELDGVSLTVEVSCNSGSAISE